MNNPVFKLLTLTLCLVLACIPARAEGRKDELQAKQLEPGALEKRLHSVGLLIEKSSAASHLKGNGAAAKQEQAQELHKQATEAFQAGDYAKASELVSQAYKLMFTSTQQTAPDEVIRKKKQRDFENRLASTKAMLDAQKRVSTEKSAGKETMDHIAQAEKLLDQANRLAATDLDKAVFAVEQAYLIAKASVGKMRQGDTLVRSLDFATKAEEYQYELDRNDTHQKLVKMVADDRKDDPGVSAMIQKFLDKALQIRDEAAKKAAAKEFEAAVELMEESTRELVRAIRAAGIFIPG